MSRYVLLAHDRTLRVTVGWDPPLQTFFGQVVRPATAPYADDTLVVWIGTRAQEIASVAQLCRQLAAYAAIPRATHISARFSPGPCPVAPTRRDEHAPRKEAREQTRLKVQSPACKDGNRQGGHSGVKPCRPQRTTYESRSLQGV